MRLTPSDPDVETIVKRIKEKIIDLQPEFQRGEVWPLRKKRQLIDTILRGWHIPPVHVVVLEDGNQEVLDGQQRLTAIRDFVNGVFAIDGHTDPPNEAIAELHGKRYEQLPQSVRTKFNNFTIRIFRLTDYEPTEPGELFYRLNQPTSLTASEQRNAFYGSVRNQIKKLVKELESLGINKDTLGFSNSRMAYDDVLARVAYSLDIGTLHEKITASNITARYRTKEPFQQNLIERISKALNLFAEKANDSHHSIRFNKTTFYSWLIFITSIDRSGLTTQFSSQFMSDFVWLRNNLVLLNSGDQPVCFDKLPSKAIDGLLAIYNNKASARVADVTSVLSRDIIIWYLFFVSVDDTYLFSQHLDSKQLRILEDLDVFVRSENSKSSVTQIEAYLEKIFEQRKWGIEI